MKTIQACWLGEYRDKFAIPFNAFFFEFIIDS